MFKGQYLHSVDSKGRVSIPAKLKKYFSPEANNIVIMIKGIDKCISVYPKNEWQIIEEQLMKLNQFDSKDQRFKRSFLQSASEDELDVQSRILIPHHLLNYAQIKDEVLILGTLKNIEFWNPKLYEEYINSSEQTFEQIAEEVMKR
ncbi:MAG: division/cell wall cluster transcriptional repressor MraZ [Chlorobiaceae bacterium]|nr:division/cell wall cluster transcriptional repressor MraZ [Chlorobiaceae bacterium]MBA4309665.1 division/cell wall cluster transcriptional repressor MraZ [Chlorobiaceae bacterium]